MITNESKQRFLTEAKPLSVVINGVPVNCVVKQFSTGSVGFNINGKVPLTLPDGTLGKLQVSGNLTLIGSKPETTQADAAAEAAAA